MKTEAERQGAKRKEGTVILLSVREDVQKMVRSTVQRVRPDLSLLLVRDWEAARVDVRRTTPRVIVFDEDALPTGDAEQGNRSSLAKAMIIFLAGFAPVIALGSPELQSELAPLSAAGAVDCADGMNGALSAGMQALERRLRKAEELRRLPQVVPGPGVQDDFGELLRHELNNPLTGILGNAELLLRDLRKVGNQHFPRGAERRLETIAALSVRMRETVRRLSTEWEAQADSEAELAGRARH